MSHKSKIVLSLLVFATLSGVIFFTSTFTWWGTLIFLYASVFLPVFFILLFTSKLVFQTWKKFAIIYLPLALIWIFLTPTSSGFLQADREIVTLWTAGGFLVISLIIIAWKSWRLRKEK